MQRILADMQKRQDEEAAAKARKGTGGGSGEVSSGESGKKKIADMTSEEKKAWYMDRVNQAKEKRAKEAIEREKASEKSRREITHAAMDMKEKNDKRMAEQLAKQKKKEEADAKALRARTREKIAAAKAERKRKEEWEASERKKAAEAAKK